MHPMFCRSVLPACFLAAAASTAAVGGDELARRGLMGVQLAPITDEARDHHKLPPSAQGALISGVMPDTPAQKAELKANDIIVKVGEQSINDFPDLTTALRRFRAGDKVSLTVLRDGGEMKFELVLAPRPKEGAEDCELIYDAAGPEGERVRTIISKPTGDGKYPAIMFIQGLAPFSVEFVGPAARHPAKRLIDDLTKAGYVVMRAERIGVGDSDGLDPQQTMTETDVKSFRAALKKLTAYDFVDPKNVFVFTHSTGGMIVPRVVEGMPVRGVITYATCTRPWNESSLDASRRRWELELLKPEEIQANSEKMSRFMQLCYLDKKAPAAILQEHADLKEFAGGFLRNDTMIDGIHYRFYQDLASLKPAEAWKKVDTDVLALWGQSDFVASRKDSEMVAEIVNTSHPGRATFVAVEGVDHMYAKATDAEESFLAGFGGQFNPVVIETVDQWIKKRMGPAKSPP